MPDDYNDKNFARENSALKILQAKCQHPNIVPLLACYRYGSQYSFLFPRADCDLYMYFEQTNPPQTAQETLYLFERISKLASALGEIHNCEIVLEADGRRIDFSQIGYHRDLKPKNILKMGEVFMISDFGLARFKDNKSNSKTTWGWGFSTYSAPECKQGANVNRLADIWSLGCIFSEVVTFAILGMDGILEYSQHRTQSLSFHMTVDLFYEHGTDRIDKVLEWFEHLRIKSGRSPFILDILELVEEMLGPVSTRPRAITVMSKFSEILGRERDRNNIVDYIPTDSIENWHLVTSPDLITDDPTFTLPSPLQPRKDTPPTTRPNTAITRPSAASIRRDTLPTPKKDTPLSTRPSTASTRRDTLPTPPKATSMARGGPMSLIQSAITNSSKILDPVVDPPLRRTDQYVMHTASTEPTMGGSPMGRSNSEKRRTWTPQGLSIGMERHVSNDPRLKKVNQPEPLFYKVPGFLAKSQKGKSPFGYLKEFDTVRPPAASFHQIS